ncbi:MAG: tyrosine-type recombinase/integrase [Propionibacteriaceae bacterium]
MSTRRGFGRIRKRQSGRFQAGYIGPDLNTHYAPTTFSTKLDAEAWLASEHRLLENDQWTSPAERNHKKHARGETFGKYSERWLGEHRRKDGRQLKPKTVAHYREVLNSRLLPDLGHLELHRLTESVLKAWYEGLPETPTVNAHAVSLLKQILSAASEDDPRIPSLRMPGPTKAETVHESEPATLEQLAVIVENMPERHRMLVLLMAFCALRFGEVTELRRKDVDLKNGRLKIRRGVVLVNGERIVGTPKSKAGSRDVSIPPHLLPQLAEHIEKNCTPGPNSLLFESSTGTHLSQSTVNGKPARTRLIHGRSVNESASGFCKARTAAGRPDLRLHDLRHTGATMAAMSGATLAELMARLGHSSVGAAMRYQHAAKDRDLAIAQEISRMAGGVL